ncbi:MAG TPA: carbohydrate ABC transporter permease [Anaerolineales bacterium]|nr:carbohydrate ABC transporter permease [Anaerolineales bacterium]
MKQTNKLVKVAWLKSVPTYLALGTVGLIITIPVLWLLISSLKSDNELSAYPIQLLPKHPLYQLITYYFTLRYPPLTLAMLRTFVLGITTAFITCISSAMAGYAFARIKGAGRKQLFSLVIALLIVPNIVLLVPQFILYARYHLIDTYWPWYLAAFGATSPLYIFMYRQFFLGFPKELEEAAEIDGASPVGIFINIILPNSKPALATILIFAFNTVWGDFITPTIFLNDPFKLLGPWLAGAPVNAAFALAGTVIYMLPVVILFLLIQKNIQKGMLFTGLHG